MNSKVLKTATTLVVLFICTAGVIYLGCKFLKNSNNQNSDELEVYKVELFKDIRDTLDSSQAISYIYDRDMNFIMTLTDESRVQCVDWIPDKLRETILSTGKVSDLVLELYCNRAGVIPDKYLETLVQCLEGEFKKEEMLRYIVSLYVYQGKYSGLIACSYSLFGTAPNLLSEAQVDYICYLFVNAEGTLETYLQSNTDIDVAALNLCDRGQLSQLKSLITEELGNIPSVDIKNNSYNIQLTLSLSKQTQMQDLVDSGMSSLLSLDTSGRFKENYSTLVLDKNYCIESYVAGRTSNILSDGFRLNSLNLTSNFEALLDDARMPGACWLRLKDYGGSSFRPLASICELFQTLSLSTDDEVEIMSVFDILNLLFSQNPNYPGYSIIREVQTMDGVSVFTFFEKDKVGCEVLPLDIQSDGVSVAYKVYNTLSLDKGGNTCWGFDISLDTGVIMVRFTTEYALIAVGGVSALGVTVSDTSMEKLIELSSEVQSLVSSSHADCTIMWPYISEELTEEERLQNVDLIQPIYEEALNLLQGTIVDSKQARRDWERYYKYLVDLLEHYKYYLPQSVFDEWEEQVDSIRKENAEVLLGHSI